MATTRWDTFQEMLSLREQVDRLLNPVTSRLHQDWVPAADVYDHGDAIFVTVDLPGVRPEDVQIQIQGHELTVRGERHLPGADGEGHQHHERPDGSFERHVALPANVAAEAVEATYEDGVLEVRVPKSSTPEPRRIEIHRGTLHSRVEGRDGPLYAVALGAPLDDADLGTVDADGTTEYDPSSELHRRANGGGKVEGGAGI